MITNLKSFDDEMNVAVFGSGGGIGQAFLKILSSLVQVQKIYSFSSQKLSIENSKVIHKKIHLNNEEEIKNAAGTFLDKERLSLIIVAVGALHNESQSINPEKSYNDISLQNLKYIYEVNTFIPALIMKHFLPLLDKNQKAVFAALSARVGSISDNNLGGWYSYRSSKAALNMLVKTASIELNRRNKKSIIVGLHPGTVDTKLSKPFQKNIKADSLFSPDKSVSCLLSVVDELNVEDSGGFFAWDGKAIGY